MENVGGSPTRKNTKQVSFTTRCFNSNNNNNRHIEKKKVVNRKNNKQKINEERKCI